MKAHKITTLMALTVALSSPVVAQYNVRLGEDRAAVVATIGVPECFQQGLVCVPNHPVPTPNLPIWEIYTRHTPSNAYGVSIRYEGDISASRLNPTPRIAQIRFTVDRPMRGEDVALDIVELHVLCLSGCEVRRQAGIRRLFLFPADASKKGSFEVAVLQFTDSHGDLQDVKDLSSLVSVVTLSTATHDQIGWTTRGQGNWKSSPDLN